MKTKGTFKKGHIVTQEMRDKISRKLKGHAKTYDGTFKKGMVMTESHRRNLSNAMKGHPVYKLKSRNDKISKTLKGRVSSYLTPIRDRIRNSRELKQWRISIFIRDDRTCLFCKYKGKNIQADHIIPLSKIVEKIKFEKGIENLFENVISDKLFKDINNGRTLCVPCHRKTDTYGGRLLKRKHKL